MRSYYVLECAQQQRIADLLYGYYVGISGNRCVTQFWNNLTRAEITDLMAIPNNPCRAWFESMGLRVRDISFTLTTSNIHTDIHRDEPPVVAKINFPVANTRDTYNVWFDDYAREIDRIECVRPIVLRSDILHTVEIGAQAVLPRLQFSFCFYNEPVHLLR